MVQYVQDTFSEKISTAKICSPSWPHYVFISFFAPKTATKSILKDQTLPYNRPSGNPLPTSIPVLHNVKVTLPPLLMDASTSPSLDPVAVRSNLRVARSSSSWLHWASFSTLHLREAPEFNAPPQLRPSSFYSLLRGIRRRCKERRRFGA